MHAAEVPVMVAVSERRAQGADIQLALENERTLNAILRCAVSNDDLPAILENCLDILLSVSWLSILPKGGVFLAEEGQRELSLVASRHLAPELHSLCARVPFGHCLCGRAAATREIQYARCVDERHETRFPGMAPHGHYNVPILAGEEVLGVIVLYLPHGHPRHEAEVQFLNNVADILSLVIRHHRVREQLCRAVEQLEILASTDVLTGLYNRRFFLGRLREEWAAAERLGLPLSLLLFDIDHFKRVNDTWGPSAGDTVLRMAGHLLRGSLRRYDVAARYGGEEFAVLLPRTPLDEAGDIAGRLRERLRAQPIDVGGETLRVTASFGVASRVARESEEGFLARCDRALYAAKQAGRDRVVLAPAESGGRGSRPRAR